jgi:hypothetical protein
MLGIFLSGCRTGGLPRKAELRGVSYNAMPVYVILASSHSMQHVKMGEKKANGSCFFIPFLPVIKLGVEHGDGLGVCVSL